MPPVAVDAGAGPAMPSPAPVPAPAPDAAADVVVPPPALGPPPAIDGVAVAYGLRDVKITIRAADGSGGRLTFQWAGAGIDGVAVGGPVRQVNNSDILASAARTVKLLVMAEDGAAALLSVKFDTQPGLLGGPRLAGSHAVRTRTSASALNAGDRACFETHTGCALGCRANGPPGAGGCVTGCGASLIRCCKDE
jgi:hypothetical protein